MRRLLLLLLLLSAPGWAQQPPLDPMGGGRPSLPPLGPTMPDLRGQTLETARVRLFEASIRDYAVQEVQVSTGVGTVVDQLPDPGVTLRPGGYRPRLTVGIPAQPVPRPSAAAPPARRGPRGVDVVAWLLLIAGTVGMVYLGRRLLDRWEPPPVQEAPGIEVTRVTAPPRKRRK